MRNRSNLLVLLGIAFFVVGGIIVYVLTNDSDDGGGGNAATAPITVVVATQDIPANTKASDAIDDGWLKETQIPTGALLAGAFQSLSQLEGGVFIQDYADGAQVTTSGVQAVPRGYELPEGFEAIAIEMSFPQGVAGYVNAGDRVNVYTAYQPSPAINGATVPHAELLLTNVRVLDTSQTVPTNGVQADASQRGGGSSIVVLLAVKTVDAEKLIFSTEFEQIYATLVHEDAAPAAPTEGIDGENILATDPATSAA